MENTAPEDEMLYKILQEIKRYENNQTALKKAVEEFFDDMLNDNSQE